MLNFQCLYEESYIKPSIYMEEMVHVSIKNVEVLLSFLIETVTVFNLPRINYSGPFFVPDLVFLSLHKNFLVSLITLQYEKRRSALHILIYKSAIWAIH